MAMTRTSRGYLHPFENGENFLYGVGEAPRTLTELAMCRLSARWRAQDAWWEKYQDAHIRDKWIKNSGKLMWHLHPRGQRSEVELSKAQIEYVYNELSRYDALRDTEYGCEVSCADRIWQSRTLVGLDELTSLQESIELLRVRYDDADEMNDDQPWFDLVDPHLYSLIYDHTFVCDEDEISGGTKIVTAPSCDESNAFGFSQCFSCIPTPFLVSSADQPLRVESKAYINNIHPDNRPLYNGIENLLTKCVPLFEHVLTDLHRNNPLRQRITGTYTYTEWDEPEEPEDSDDEQGWAEYRHTMAHWSLDRPICLPDVPHEGFIQKPESTFHVSLRGRKIKIITRVSELRIRPGGPAFQSTPWHVEGMRNDHIVACALFCAEMENLGRPSVDLRMAVTAPREFRRGDVGATIRTWGFTHQSPCNQLVGRVSLRTNTAVAFPNIYQHRFSGAHLEDDSKHGSMTVVGLFLVDPDFDECPGAEHMAPTTAQVPPQQKEWMRRAVEEHIDVRLPFEVVEQIVDLVDGVMTEGQAREYARDMREERQQFWKEHDRKRFCLRFDAFAPSG